MSGEDGELPAYVVERIEEAERALDEGRSTDAFSVLAELDARLPERWALEAEAWLDLDELERAEEALRRTRELLGDDVGPGLLSLEGEVHLRAWRPAEAKACFEEVRGLADVTGDARADACDKLALLADLAGDRRRADKLAAEADRLLGGPGVPPPRLASKDFERLVAEAAADLPDAFRAALERVPVVIDPMPTAELLEAPASGHPPDLFGLFVGRPLWEEEASGYGELPPRIHVFQRNLERTFPERASLEEQVRITLYHELGHALGFDEEGVDDMGLA